MKEYDKRLSQYDGLDMQIVLKDFKNNEVRELYTSENRTVLDVTCEKGTVLLIFDNSICTEALFFFPFNHTNKLKMKYYE